MKRVTRKFLEVPCCNSAKQQQRNIPKSVLHVIVLIKPTDFFGCFRCLHGVALHDFIFCLSEKYIDIDKSYTFIPG